MNTQKNTIQIDLPRGILAVEGRNFLDLSPLEIGTIVHNHATFNYTPIPGVNIVGPGPNAYTLEARLSMPSGVATRIITDAHSTYSAANFGHGNQEILAKYNDFLTPKKQFLVHAQTNNPYAAAFLQAMSETSGMDRVFPKVAGTEGPDTAIDAACRYWQKEHPRSPHKPIIVAAKHCFHGRTETARRLYEDKEVQNFGDAGDYSKIIKIPFGDIDALSRVLMKYQYQIAAFIVEPIQGEGGIHVPPDDYLPLAVQLCREWNVVSIFDEVQTGYGRAGYPFYFQKYGSKAKPNIVCFGKAAGCGLTELSGIAGDSKILECFEPSSQGSTWSRTPGPSYAGIIALWYLAAYDLCAISREKGMLLKSCLLDLQKRYPDDIQNIRGEGLFVGMELTKKHNPRKFVERLLFEGNVLSGVAHGTTLRIMPPLIITQAGLDAIVDAIELTLHSL
ncbi:MAG: aspartate aminotransferase family protein [Parcubacteria group bacterium]|nr:aspartate aminotransferase family protein [Parcubacteria group bacterium]